MSALSKHVGHRAVLRDATHLRCTDCAQTIVLPSPSTTRPTSTSSQILNIKDPAGCRLHAGQLAVSCGPCRADRLVEGLAS